MSAFVLGELRVVEEFQQPWILRFSFWFVLSALVAVSAALDSAFLYLVCSKRACRC
jgi:hypothetical protein